MSRVTYAFPLLLALAAACRDQSAVPTAGRPLFAAAAPAACPTPATVTVSDEAGRRPPRAAPAPRPRSGDPGMIGLTPDDPRRSAGVTLYLAAPGTRLVGPPGRGGTGA